MPFQAGVQRILEGTNSKIIEAEKRKSEVEDRTEEINEAERGKEKELKEMRTTWDLWANVKCPNIRSIDVPEEKDKEKGHEKVLEEIKDEHFPKMGKEIATQV